MIRANTRELLGLLTDLALTAADPATGSSTAGILLHTARGYVGGEPGQTDLLVGTSTTGTLLGHAHIQCSGQHAAMLWGIHDVHVVLAVLKPLAKDKEHQVQLGFDDDGQVALIDDPDLFDDHMTLTFGSGDPAEWPTVGVHAMLTEARIRPGDDAPPASPRTDFTAHHLSPFSKIASRRGEIMEFYRYHQRLPLSIQIGSQYRGIVRPYQWKDEMIELGAAPGGDVYPLVLPAEDAAA